MYTFIFRGATEVKWTMSANVHPYAIDAERAARVALEQLTGHTAIVVKLGYEIESTRHIIHQVKRKKKVKP